MIILVVLFSIDLIKSNFQVFLFSISPQPLWNPGFVTIDYSPQLADHQITLLAHLITATPGTLTVDVNCDECKITVHVLYLGLKTRSSLVTSSQIFENHIRHAF
jgi:multicomponent Na+:H+ antiporter subunit E